MRLLHSFDDNVLAERLAKVLRTRDLQAEVRSQGGKSGVWILDEEHVEAAKEWLTPFLANPNAPEWNVREEPKPASKRPPPVRRIRPGDLRPETPIVSFVYVAIAGLAFVSSFLPGHAHEALAPHFAGSSATDALVRLLTSPKAYTLFTPVFLHAGLLHIFFNVTWILQLGGSFERVHGPAKTLAFYVACGTAGVITELYWSQAIAVGLSGIVYGLLAYVWVRRRYDITFPIRLEQSTMVWMMAWFALGFLGMMGIANGAHTGGLVVGAIVGYLASPKVRRR